ncbi:hypothetical protein [Candidatus Sneabacter namystus]|uniref:Rod shape-determining protein MreD n=1 Tax=Candidatus Sneabacter namystus TaxID=2601646 RepID=A0A5C0UI34_9RICK|nr:hypothetical protein [Candidatus Sneabacter namystus]QEK39410.1 hypothetical protein FZC37_00430 [Candidatus Sneabacter namystus]
MFKKRFIDLIFVSSRKFLVLFLFSSLIWLFTVLVTAVKSTFGYVGCAPSLEFIVFAYLASLERNHFLSAFLYGLFVDLALSRPVGISASVFLFCYLFFVFANGISKSFGRFVTKWVKFILLLAFSYFLYSIICPPVSLLGFLYTLLLSPFVTLVLDLVRNDKSTFF